MDAYSIPLYNKTVVISLIEREINGGFIPINDFTPLSLITDEEGIVNFMLDLSHGNYRVMVSFDGDTTYKPSNMTFNVSVSKINTEIKILGDYNLSNITTCALSNEELMFYLIDAQSNIIKNDGMHLKISQLDQILEINLDI